MRLHQILGRICALFSVVVFTFNVFTPDNPDHWLNLAETLVLAVLFTCALMFPEPIAKTLHVLLFGTIAGIAVFTDTGFFASAVMTVSTFVLIYAYGGFVTMTVWKLPLSSVICYGVCLVGVMHYDPPSIQAYSRAAVWTLFIAMFITFLWLVVWEIRRKFYEGFASELIQQNHDLLKEVRDLAKRCNDGQD